MSSYESAVKTESTPVSTTLKNKLRDLGATVLRVYVNFDSAVLHDRIDLHNRCMIMRNARELNFAQESCCTTRHSA